MVLNKRTKHFCWSKALFSINYSKYFFSDSMQNRNPSYKEIVWILLDPWSDHFFCYCFTKYWDKTTDSDDCSGQTIPLASHNSGNIKDSLVFNLCLIMSSRLIDFIFLEWRGGSRIYLHNLQGKLGSYFFSI